MPWLRLVFAESARISDHVFIWGFPEIIHELLNEAPPHDFEFVAWLTWYYKNCPSVIRGWRSAQYACLHFSRPGAKMYPEHFLNDNQMQKHQQGKLRYMPGPGTVIEAPLNIGFVGRGEQTGHPAQKPESLFEPLVSMTTEEGDTVLDPFCGAGTTGAVCRAMRRRAILCDISDEYLQMAEKRLKLQRSLSLPGGAAPVSASRRRALARLRRGLDLRWTLPRSRGELHER
jgi:site-specific DNA-methyltransferase (adenine-specific)